MATAAVTEIGYRLLDYLWEFAKDQLVKYGTDWAANGFSSMMHYLIESESELESRMGVKNYQKVLDDFRKGAARVRTGGGLGFGSAQVYYVPKVALNQYMEGTNKALHSISKWCIIPSTGDDELDHLMDLYWNMTNPQPPHFYGSFWNYMDENPVSENSDYDINDHTGKSLPVKGAFKIKQNLQNQDQHSLQALMDAAKVFFSKNVGLFVGENATEGVYARSKADFLDSQAPKYMQYISSIFENQLNTLSNVVLEENDGLAQRYRGMINLYSKEFFFPVKGQLEPVEMFNGFGEAIKRTLDHGTYKQA